MGNDTALLLRPEWVFEVAREVERFVQSLRNDGVPGLGLDRFFATLPIPERELEDQLLHELRCRLASLSRQHACTRAERARQLLIQEYRKPWTLARLARAVGCNRTTLQEEFRNLTRTSVHVFLVRHRVAVAKRLLIRSDLKVSRVAEAVGYRSHSAFARHFKSVTGLTLTTYRLRRNGSAADRERLPVERAPIIR